MKKLVNEGISQLVQKIGNFADTDAGYARPISGVDRESVKNIFPILVVLESSMSTPLMNDYLDMKFQERLKDHKIDSRFRVHSLILLTVGDLERAIPYFLKLGTWRCLEDYIYGNGHYYMSGFRIYIKEKLYKHEFLQSGFVMRKFDMIRDKIMAILSTPLN
jgi:hypothetical protein